VANVRHDVTSADVKTVELSDVSLEALEGLDDSALSQALRRLARDQRSTGDGVPAMHSSTTHSSSFSQSPW
jgi:FXSXX-COOH protein